MYNYGYKKFSETFCGDVETPEVIKKARKGGNTYHVNEVVQLLHDLRDFKHSRGGLEGYRAALATCCEESRRGDMGRKALLANLLRRHSPAQPRCLLGGRLQAVFKNMGDAPAPRRCKKSLRPFLGRLTGSLLPLAFDGALGAAVVAARGVSLS
eukprot:scaffold1312_cov264-Pinguiococcus_pyrenoidosus.AAC.2